VVAVLLGWIVLDERLAGSTLVGAAAVLAGMVLATWRRRRPAGSLENAVVVTGAASPRGRRTPT
jgi:drug/metabolite transporter (DMT)-like permease